MGSRAEQDAKSRMIKEVEELLHSQTGRLEQMRRNFEETKTQALLEARHQSEGASTTERARLKSGLSNSPSSREG